MLEQIGKKKPVRTRTARIDIRISPEDKAEIQRRAAQRNLSVREYLTQLAVSRPGRTQKQIDDINLLRECVTKLEAIKFTIIACSQSGAPITEDLNQQMRDITEAISAVW